LINQERTKIIRKVQALTMLIVACSLTRAIIVLINIECKTAVCSFLVTIYPTHHRSCLPLSVDPFVDAWIEPVYYVCLEVVPLSIMIFILNYTREKQPPPSADEEKPLISRLN
jgi:hypothetical protein